MIYMLFRRTWWKKRTNSCRLLSDLHRSLGAQKSRCFQCSIFSTLLHSNYAGLIQIRVCKFFSKQTTPAWKQFLLCIYNILWKMKSILNVKKQSAHTPCTGPKWSIKKNTVWIELKYMGTPRRYKHTQL